MFKSFNTRSFFSIIFLTYFSIVLRIGVYFLYNERQQVFSLMKYLQAVMSNRITGYSFHIFAHDWRICASLGTDGHYPQQWLLEGT